ncbi:MAG: hypothetical protein CM1200mP35_00910 [Chloroflexota bacterium]|nr:MAG: hypothetical protein CM1200mP35_00910 [Chloroflexota bacterium]
MVFDWFSLPQSNDIVHDNPKGPQGTTKRCEGLIFMPRVVL